MKLTDASLRNPAAVAVVVAMVCALGLMSLLKLPLQLFPDIERPQMSIQTAWRAASPASAVVSASAAHCQDERKAG